MKIQHKKLIICIIYVVVLFVVVMFNDKIGQHVSDSAINFIIALATCTLGMFYGLGVAVIAPIAVLVFNQLFVLPFYVAICMANIMYVLVLHIAPGVIEHSIKPFLYLTPMLGAAILKYFIQYFAAVEIAPTIFDLSQISQQTFTQLFGPTQLITALVGSILGVTAATLYKLIIGKHNEIQPI